MQEDTDDLTKDFNEWKQLDHQKIADAKAWALQKAEGKLEAKEAELRLVELEQ